MGASAGQFFIEYTDFGYLRNGVSCGYNHHLSISANSPSEKDIIVTPNPASAYVNIRNYNPGSYTIRLVDQLGKTLKICKTHRQNETISVVDIPSGYYYLTIISEDWNQVYKRIVIAH